MKFYALTIALLLCQILFAHASIINGFSQEKSLLEKEIRSNVKLLNEDNTEKAIRQIEKKLKHLRKEYTVLLKKYLETEQLILVIEFIDPELFAEVSKVTNAEGTLTHVYVRYVGRTSREFTQLADNHFVAKGYTSMRQSDNNKNVCCSRYGTNTISITIAYGCDEKIALCHEFAHVLYVVPNLSGYMEYWNSSNHFNNGHNIADPSYFIQESVERSFLSRYDDYLNKAKSKGSSKHNIASHKKRK